MMPIIWTNTVQASEASIVSIDDKIQNFMKMHFDCVTEWDVCVDGPEVNKRKEKREKETWYYKVEWWK